MSNLVLSLLPSPHQATIETENTPPADFWDTIVALTHDPPESLGTPLLGKWVSYIESTKTFITPTSICLSDALCLAVKTFGGSLLSHRHVPELDYFGPLEETLLAVSLNKPFCIALQGVDGKSLERFGGQINGARLLSLEQVKQFAVIATQRKKELQDEIPERLYRLVCMALLLLPESLIPKIESRK